MAKPRIHKRTIYYLPTWQGGDIEIALCRRAAVGWSDNPHSFPIADIRVTCPCCLGMMAHGVRPNGSRGRGERAA